MRLTAVTLALLFLGALVAAQPACSSDGTATPNATATVLPTGVDVKGFLAAARQAQCADRVNKLFIIDDQMVFWVEEGNCSDASYAYTLFGKNLDTVLCTEHDSIAGPVSRCNDDTSQALFTTIVANRTRPDLGLGSSHKVQQVSGR